MSTLFAVAKASLVAAAPVIAAPIITSLITPGAPSTGNYVSDYVRNPLDPTGTFSGSMNYRDVYEIRSLMDTLKGEKFVTALFGGRRVGDTAQQPDMRVVNAVLAQADFRSGIITGLPGKTPGLRPELSPRQQLANQFAGTQTLIRAIMGSGGQASPGGGAAGRVQNDVLLKLTRLAEISDEGNEKANDINAKLGMGVITYRQANRTLDSLLAEQQNVKRLIAGQKTTVNVTNQTTISAVAAQRSLTIVANSHRAIIE